MDTWMLIGLAMFQIEDQLVVSCFLLEVVLLVGAVRNNQQLHYQIRKQNTEAQQIAACEVVWLKKLLSNLGQLVDVPIVIYCDNISSILLAKNPIYHAKTKHIEVHYNFIRKKISRK
jgi:hypothetical protein